MNDPCAVKTHYMPLPELLTGRPGTYEILDANELKGLPTNGMVDQVEQVMVVPLDEPGLVVARHECGHVLWSPETPPKVRGYPGYLQAVEDGRINRGLACIGLPMRLDEKSLARVVELGAPSLDKTRELRTRLNKQAHQLGGGSLKQPDELTPKLIQRGQRGEGRHLTSVQ